MHRMYTYKLIYSMFDLHSNNKNNNNGVCEYFLIGKSWQTLQDMAAQATADTDAGEVKVRFLAVSSSHLVHR